MGLRQARQQPLAARSEPDEHPAAVGGVPAPHRQAPILQSIDELHGAVVAQEEPIGELADARPRAPRPPDGQQELVLPRLEPYRAGLPLREGQEPPDVPAQLRQSAVVDLSLFHARGRLSAPRAQYIVSRYELHERLEALGARVRKLFRTATEGPGRGGTTRPRTRTASPAPRPPPRRAADG